MRRLGAVAGDTEEAGRPVAIFTVVSIALLMYAMDQTIVATALHTLQRDLHASITCLGWTINAYAFGQLLVLPLMGRLSLRYGPRRIFLISVAVFAAASLGCALADTVYLLIVMRVLEAVGGAGFTPAATGIVVAHFGAARDRAVGLFGSVFPIGAMIGPILGGLFVTYWSWRGIFLINVPLGALLVALALWLIPPDRTIAPGLRGGLDLAGIAYLGIGVLGILGGVTLAGGQVAHHRAAWPVMVGSVTVGLFGLAAFVRHGRRTPDPIVPARLIVGRGFGVLNTINFLLGGISLGLGALIPLYATQRYNMGALASGTLLTVRGVATIVLAVFAAWTLRRTGYHSPMFVGFAIIAAGMVALALHPVYVSPYLWLSVAAGVTGIGIGWSSPAVRNACLQLVPDESAAIAALRTMGMQAGAITFLSVATAILAVSRNQGLVQAGVFAVSGLLLIIAMPLIRLVPEHRGIW